MAKIFSFCDMSMDNYVRKYSHKSKSSNSLSYSTVSESFQIESID